MLAFRKLLEPLIAPQHPQIAVRHETSAHVMATIQNRPIAEMQLRMDQGHRAYIASRNGEDAAWGWVATQNAVIGELAATITLPSQARYLWNFVTRAEHRGQGVYPQLLARILEIESQDATDFYIAWAPENHASRSGIAKAGFIAIAEMSYDRSGAPAIRALDLEHEQRLHTLLALPQHREPLTPCWKCVRAGRGAMSCTEGQCHCDYQRVQQECAA